ncbi:hypothetical protein ACF07S_10555 [Streptomyces sp. NPDC016640]|uniref:hypothetical protein n=1 Tax=Streptomyces sp. NPDC016640 TaxID=3364969 RepID=UPI00370063DE
MNDFDLDTVRAPVALRCSTQVGDRQIAEVQEVPRLAWEDADELMRNTLKGALRNRLADRVLAATGALPDYGAIGREPVEVHVPTDLQDQLYRETLARAGNT